MELDKQKFISGVVHNTLKRCDDFPKDDIQIKPADLKFVLEYTVFLEECLSNLQKEKAEYEARWNNTAHELRIFKNECVPKCNIREKIKMLKKIYELVNVESEADYCLRSKINILEDLLKEE